jgi:hypothetical protein
MEGREMNPDIITGVLLTGVDARVRGGLLTTCEFSGHKKSPDNLRECKHHEPASHHSRCMYYRDETGGCDCIKD